MNIPFWLLRLLPLFEYICPRCRKEVKQNSHECPHCHEKYPLALKIPPTILKDRKKLEAYVHKHVFPRVSEFERNYLTKYFTIIFPAIGSGVEGFETNDFSTWDGTNTTGGTITTSSNKAHHGIYSARVQITTIPLSNVAANAYKNIGAQPNGVYLRSYLYFSSFGNTANGSWITLGSVATAAYQAAKLSILAHNDNGTYKWEIQHDGDAWAPHISSSVIALDRWYCVELHYDNTNSEIELYTDGTRVVYLVGQTLTVTDYITVGCHYTGDGNPPADFYIDCVVAADARIGCEIIGVNLTLTNDMIFLT